MRKRLIVGWVIGIVILILVLISLSFSRAFFTYHFAVKSETMIIEAWVPSFEMEQAIKMIKTDSITRVIIIGKNYTDDRESILSMFLNDDKSTKPTGDQGDGGVWLLTNSAIALNLMTKPVACELDDSLTIEIRAKGSESAGHFAHFNLVVNGTCYDGAFTTGKDSVFSFVMAQPADGLQSIIIYFNNDLVHKGHDRNLNIKSVRVGDFEAEINERNTFIINEDGKYSNGFESQAGEMGNYLIQLGVNPEKVKIISFEPYIRNQTLAAARALIKSPFFNGISSVNIVSSGIHSRRSWITYQRILGKEVAVGLIHFEQSDFNKGTLEDNASQFFLLAEEAFSYLVNWILFSVGLL